MGNEKIKLQIDELRFSWDEDKAEANFRKHGVTFEIATEVFFDENYLEHEERRDGETRYQILGKTFSPLVLFIVFVERITVDDEEIYRIISARKATKKEREDYEERRSY